MANNDGQYHSRKDNGGCKHERGYNNQRQGSNPSYGSQQTLETPDRLTEDNYVELADRVMKNLKGLTTSKIRNLLAMTADIYNDVVQGGEWDDGMKGRINYLRIRFAYEAGRDEIVAGFVERANLIRYAKKAGESPEDYKLFSRYMEALVAYHRFYGGKD